MSKKQAIELVACPVCGGPGLTKDVAHPFTHGWVGCKTCQRFIRWTGKGKRSAVDQWNKGAKHEL